MTTAPVRREQRYTYDHPCPICGGSDRDPRGHGTRCYGFCSDDGEWARCTREEYAGDLPMELDTNAYVHRLVNDCRCGTRHNPAPPIAPRSNGHHPQRQIDRTYSFVDEDGVLLFQEVKWKPKSFSLRRPDGNGGWIWNLDGTRRVLYRLPDLMTADPERMVFFVEGPKDADRLCSLGLLATSIPMGAGKYDEEYNTWLVDRNVAILPDNDAPGWSDAQQKAARLHGIASSVRIVQLPNLPPAGDVSDWLDAGGTVDELKRLVVQTPCWEPSPSRIDVPASSSAPVEQAAWPEPPGMPAFAGFAGEVVDAIDPYTESDPVAILGHLLAAFGSAVGAMPHAQVGATRHAVREHFVFVGRTSKARKGDSFQPIERLFRAVDPDWAGRRVLSGLSSGEGLIYAVRDPVEKEEPIKKQGHITGYQSVVIDCGEDDKRLLVVEPEFARVLRTMSRQGNTLSALIRQAWDSGDLRSMTKTPLAATGAHVSIVGHITIEELRREMADVEMVNGLGNRFVWLAVRRSKALPEPAPFEGVIVNDLVAKLKRRLDSARGVGRLDRDSEARALWLEIYSDLSAEQDGLAGAMLARAEAHVLRLALLYALLDGSGIVQIAHLESALALWDYAARSVIHIFSDATGDPVADTIAAALKQAGSMKRSEISALFGRHESSARISQALAALHRAGKARMRSEETAGRPIEWWDWVRDAG